MEKEEVSIKDLSIANLKAAYDFLLEEAEYLESYANEKKIAVKDIPAYKEIKAIYSNVYNELLNRVRSLK